MSTSDKIQSILEMLFTWDMKEWRSVWRNFFSKINLQILWKIFFQSLISNNNEHWTPNRDFVILASMKLKKGVLIYQELI